MTMENYFRSGTKSFEVIERLNKKESDEEIIKAMGLKSKQIIYNIRSIWKKKDALAKSKSLESSRIPEKPVDVETLNQFGGGGDGGSGQSPGVDVDGVDHLGELALQPNPQNPPPGNMQALQKGYLDMQRKLDTMEAVIKGFFTDQNNVGLTSPPMPATIEVDKGTLIKRTLYLTPKTMMLFDIAVADGYPGELSEYINDLVSGFYKKRGLTLGLVTRREIP